MRLVSRDCVRISFCEVLKEEQKAHRVSDLKRERYFTKLKYAMYDFKKKIDYNSIEDAYIYI